jgi:hypothetical protein
MEPLSEQELDVAMARGFLEEWLKNENVVVLDNLKVLADGVAFYRQKYLEQQSDYAILQDHYNRLTAQSAQYLQYIQSQKEQMDQLLIDNQRGLHKPENEFGTT